MLSCQVNTPLRAFPKIRRDIPAGFLVKVRYLPRMALI
jgi:hypothetical protein